MRVVGEEEVGGFDPAPVRKKIENIATMQPRWRWFFIAEGNCLSEGNKGYHPNLSKTDLLY
jgi:hypothetical protein